MKQHSEPMPTKPTSSSASPSRAELRAAKAKEKAKAARNHDRYVQKAYGLAPGEYAAKLAEQDGRCAICTRRPRNRRLAVDHDHETGAIRALLCYTCNHFVLGFVEFDPIAAHNAAVYLAAIAAAFGPEYDPMPKRVVEPSQVHTPQPMRLSPLRFPKVQFNNGDSRS